MRDQSLALGKYDKENHAELDALVKLWPEGEPLLDALHVDQRHWVALSIEANLCNYANDLLAGHEVFFTSDDNCILCSGESSYQDVISSNWVKWNR